MFIFQRHSLWITISKLTYTLCITNTNNHLYKNRDRLTKDFLANSDLIGESAQLWPLGRRITLLVCSVLAANKWCKQGLQDCTSLERDLSLSSNKSATLKSLLTICHLLAFISILWMLSMCASDAYPYQAGDAYWISDMIMAWKY